MACYGNPYVSGHTLVRVYNNPELTFCSICHYPMQGNDTASIGYYHCVKCNALDCHRNCYETSRDFNPPPKETCSICLESMNDPSRTTVITECGHLFHEDCLADVRSNLCPLCRQNRVTLGRVELYGKKRRSRRSRRSRRPRRSQKR